MLYRWLTIHALVALSLSAAASISYAQTISQSPPRPGTLANDAKRDPSQQGAYPQQPAQEPPPISTVRQHWTLFLDETFSPLSAASTISSAAFSHVTNSDPRYGTNATAFGQRMGASAADVASQNFFGDFLVASAFHEDPRYFRRGEQYSFWYRVGYAVSRAFVIRTASGGSSFNWDNLLGSAMRAGFSNLYYPPPSRTGGAILIHFGTSVADTGLVNLAPEFWPDFRRKVLHWHHHGQPATNEATPP